MTVYFASSEDSDFNMISGAATSGVVGSWDPAFSRYSMRIAGNGSYVQASFPPLTDLWVSCQGYLVNNYARDLFRLFNGSTACFRAYAYGSLVYLQHAPSGTFATLVYTGNIPLTTRTKIDIHLVLHETNGRFDFYVNELLSASWTGDTAAITAAIDNVRCISQDGNGAYHVSEVVVADEDTRPFRVKSLAPAGEGATSGWTGSYTDIRESTMADGGITTDTDGVVSTYTLPAHGLNTDWYQPKTVFVGASAARGETGPSHLQFVARSGGTDYTGPSIALETGFTPVKQQWESDPATAADWTFSGIDALETGVKAVSS